MRSLAFAKDYVRELLDVRLNIDSESMLNIGWKLLAKHFKVFELGIKQEFIDKYWPGEKD